MPLDTEASQLRFLATTLPALTLFTHLLLALSFSLPSTSSGSGFPFVYNVVAAGASIVGLIGAIRCKPQLISAYTFTHTATLIFVTLALLNMLLPYPLALFNHPFNPVIPSWQVDESAICRDIDAGLSWSDDWLVECEQKFWGFKIGVAGFGLVLMAAQWWALWTVRAWGREMTFLKRQGAWGRGDEESMTEESKKRGW